MESINRSRTTTKTSSRSKSLNDRGSITKNPGKPTRSSNSARQVPTRGRSRSVQLSRDPCDANLYTTVFGPTADETILVGLKTFMTICSECSSIAVAVPSDSNRRQSSVTYVDPDGISSKTGSTIPSLTQDAPGQANDALSKLLENDLDSNVEEEEEMVNQSLTEESIEEESTTNNRSASLPFPQELIITPPPSHQFSPITPPSHQYSPTPPPQKSISSSKRNTLPHDDFILPSQNKSKSLSISQYEPLTHSSQNQSKLSQHNQSNRSEQIVSSSPINMQRETSVVEDIPEDVSGTSSPQDSFHPARSQTKSSVRNTPIINYSMHAETKKNATNSENEKQKTSSSSYKDASSETCSCCSCNAEPPKIIIKKCECHNEVKSKSCKTCCKPTTHIKIDCLCSTESQTDDSCQCRTKPTRRKCPSKVSICSKCCNKKVSCQSCMSVCSSANCQTCRQTCRQKEVKVCCDCSTSTTDCESECGSCANEAGDGVIGEIRYAICKITKFCSYTTFEVMKSTRKKPKVMPSALEGVFVLRNKDCPDEDKCCVKTVTIECQ